MYTKVLPSGVFAVFFICLYLLSFKSHSQSKRLKQPLKKSNIKSADDFVSNSFKLYHKVFIYDSLTKANVEIPSNLENELLDSTQKDLDSLWHVLPTIVDDMSNGDASVLKKGKATINLNKAKKALKYCITTVKNHFINNTSD